MPPVADSWPALNRLGSWFVAFLRLKVIPNHPVIRRFVVADAGEGLDEALAPWR
jgi:hypothetical protein